MSAEMKEPSRSAQDAEQIALDYAKANRLQTYPYDLANAIAAALEAKQREIERLRKSDGNHAWLYRECLKTLGAREQERDTLAQQLADERKGWPHEQPLTDVPLDRQIVLLNRQLADKKQQLEQAVGLVDVLLAPTAKEGKARHEFLSSPAIAPIRERVQGGAS